MAYRFIEGESLERRTSSGALSLIESVGIGAGIADALAHAHARGILHRDVTSGNVIVTPDLKPVLVDFGLALPWHGEHVTTTGTTLGTAPYLAPEVIQGHPSSARSDLYGLGVILFRMVTGKLPFDGAGAEAVMYRILNSEAPVPSSVRQGVPPQLDDITLRLLEKDPHARYGEASQV